MSLRKDALWTAADTFISSGLSFLMRLVVARMLSTHDFGIASMALTTIAIIQVFNDFGLTSAIMQKEKERLTPSLVNATFFASVAVSLVLFAIVSLAVAPLSARYFEEPLVAPLTIALAFGLLLSPFSSMSTALMFRERRFREVAIIRSIATLVSLSAVAVLIFIRPDPWVVVCQALVSQCVSALALYYASSWRPKFNASVKGLREIFNYSGLVFLSDLTVSLANNAGVMIVGRVLGASEVGMYSLAIYMTDTVRRAISSVLNRVMFVHYAQNKHDPAVMKAAYLRTLSWNCRVIFPFMTMFILFGPSLTVHFLGPAWTDMGAPLQWLALSVMIGAAGGTTSTLYKAIGRPGMDLCLFLATTILLLAPGIYIGASVAGLLGVAIATAAAKLLAVILRQALLERLLGFSLLDVLPLLGRSLFFQFPLVLAWAVRVVLFPQASWVIDGLLLALGLAAYAALDLRPLLAQALGRLTAIKG
jgi:teichuronic acid exporter